ncbi:hypothetical protein [Enterococcus sp. LJL51]|uniref:hypothetical protein n=1 Tax=Enterococcus sp. LJL51 TaxID=3416656 RepID=UPI003CF6D249
MKTIKSAVFFEQIIRYNKSNESDKILMNKLFSDNILEVKTLRNSSFYYFLEQVIEHEILDANLLEKVKKSVQRAHENLEAAKFRNYSLLITKLLHNGMFEFYDLSEVFCSNDKLLLIIQNMDRRSIINLYSKMKDNHLINDNISMKIFEAALEDTVIEEIHDELIYEDSAIASEIIAGMGYDYEDHELIESELIQKLEEKIFNEIETFNEVLPEGLVIGNVYNLTREIVSRFNISDTVYDLFRGAEKLEDKFTNRKDSDVEMIKSMFEK